MNYGQMKMKRVGGKCRKEKGKKKKKKKKKKKSLDGNDRGVQVQVQAIRLPCLDWTLWE